MSMTRAELREAALQAFGDGGGGGEFALDADRSWSTIADMGWLMMAVPEPLGGLGLGVDAAGVIHAALGRALVPGPAIAQMLAIAALAGADGVEGRDELLAAAMAGEVMTASLMPDAGAVTAVPDADRASHLLTRSPDHVALVPLAGARLTERVTWDRTRRLFDVVTAADPITLATGDAAAVLADRLEAQLLLALAADSLGGADGVLTMTIAYLEVRRQFDRPLALFQALKHRVADMKTWLAAAEALFWARVADPSADLTQIGALKAHATSVYRTIAEEAIQLHGGIGLTMEHPCHLFLKRATLNAVLGGDADYWEERAGREIFAASVGSYRMEG